MGIITGYVNLVCFIIIAAKSATRKMFWHRGLALALLILAVLHVIQVNIIQAAYMRKSVFI